MWEGAHSVKAFNPIEFFELAANALFMQAVRFLRITVPRTLLSEDRRFCTTEQFDLTMGGIYLGVEGFFECFATVYHKRLGY